MSGEPNAMPTKSSIPCPECGDGIMEYGMVYVGGSAGEMGDPDGYLWSCELCDCFCSTIDLLRTWPELHGEAGPFASWVDKELEKLDDPQNDYVGGER